MACDDIDVAKKVIAMIGERVDLTGNSLLSKFNGIDVDQTQDYVKMHCASYINCMLEAHKWNSGHPNESQWANIEPLPASVVQQIDSEEGPTNTRPKLPPSKRKWDSDSATYSANSSMPTPSADSITDTQ